jgi:hypothetical protein
VFFLLIPLGGALFAQSRQEQRDARRDRRDARRDRRRDDD